MGISYSHYLRVLKFLGLVCYIVQIMYVKKECKSSSPQETKGDFF